RLIGPAGMSGRVADIDAVVADPDVVYVGATTGGVWKSTNGGLTFKPVFDDQPVHAVGAVAVYQPNPDIVWVGTGEGNPRNSVSVGNGVYKSVDAGRSWRHLGLADSERIHRILLHPSAPGVAYVCALGKAWGEHPERGVFKTSDGGESWTKVLYVDETTGCGDLVMDPANPDKLIAGLWQYRRWPYFFESGGPGSGIFLTYDGGASWKKLREEDGLPSGELGRTGLAISRSDPAIVYALVEAEKSALLRSEDGGESWQTVNDDAQVAPRPFYFADIRVDPTRPHRVYNLEYQVRVSDDGGRSFRVLPGLNWDDIHGDHHALWIHPHDPTLIYNGNDGGMAISRDRGETFRFVSNLPLGQFYHLAVDMETPYNVYGGLQDNGSWRGPSAVWQEGGIRNSHWREVGGGDGFETLPDPEDATRGYSMWQGGQLYRWNLDTGEMRCIRPPVPDPGTKLRFNWSAGLAIDPFDPATIYYGSQFVHRSSDRGETWTIISPDLTTDNPEWQRQAESGGITLDVTMAENYTSILVVEPSPLERGLLWIGTDDGRLHLTRDGGESWKSLEDRLRGVPKNTWIPHIAASPIDPGTAFVVLDDHRRSNFKPYVYRTDDYGESWKSLATDELRGYALVIAQDPVQGDLLYLGTEFGLWISLDGGGSWMAWKHGLPTASVMDLVLHPREHDLVIGTHGRSVYILDDVRPLRALSAEILAKPLHLFPIADAQQYWERPQAGGFSFGAGEFHGGNRPYGALITFSLDLPGLPHPDEKIERERKEAGKQEASAEPVDEVKIEITDAAGTVLRTLRSEGKLGLNRVVWDLSRDLFKMAPWREPSWYAREAGPAVPPGTYRVTVRIGDDEASGEVRVLADPRSDNSPEDWQRRWETALRIGALDELTVDAILRIRRTYEDVDTVSRKIRQRLEDEGEKDEKKIAKHPLVVAGEELRKGLRGIEDRLWFSDESKGIPEENDVVTTLFLVGDYALGSWGPPSPSHLAYVDQAEAQLERMLEELNGFFVDEVEKYRLEVRKEGISLLPAFSPLELAGEDD
ncbi:MAG: hypothetical protein GY856_29285, partial [bacterium]|nr:hypothetical protein [bacterium]